MSRGTHPRFLQLAILALLPLPAMSSLGAGQGDIESRLAEDRESRIAGPAALIIEQAQRGRAPAPAIDADLPEAARVERALELLGESPVAAILSALPLEARKFNDHLITLANPFFEGRAPGTAGNRFAADYIEHYFRSFDLDPAFASSITARDGTDVLEPRSSFRQPFSAGREVRVVDRSAALILPAGRFALPHERDFTVLGASGTGRATGPVIFAGYGIVDGPDGYSSFPPEADFTGKIVMLLRFEPMTDEGSSRWAERGWSPAAQLEAKIAAATERNAAGVVLVNPPGADDPRANALIETRAMIGGRALGRSTRTPVVMISRTAAEDLFRAAFPDGDVTLSRAREQADLAGISFELPDVSMEISARIAREDIMTDNVGAILTGRGDLADEFIVIGAHYDHIGYGPAGVINPANIGTLHPGADDNASGTAGLLILAEKLSQAYEELPPHEPARSILFLAFSGEELGLLGSRHFVSNPPLDFSLEQIYLMLNLDMIGRLRETGERASGLTVQGFESGAGLLEWLQPYLDHSGIMINHASVVSGNSDHASFYRRQIPILFFFTGLHTDYHRPSDVGARINQAGAARIIQLAHDIVLGLAQREEPIEFVGRGRRQAGNAEEQQRAVARELMDDAARQAPASPRMGAGVRFGIAPAYEVDAEGILVDDVPEDGSAHAAGIRPGDRMIRWNDQPIADVRAWMGMLQQHSPGDVVKVTVLRDGQELTLTATLQGRDPE